MSTIPRFLLPRRGPMWQTQLSAGQLAVARARQQPASRRCLQSVRNMATTSSRPAKPQPPAGNILEKPAKFNPPSHGARLPRRTGNANAPSSQHYGGDLSAAEQAAQRTRQYPGMMAPPGTWAHWFLTSRMFHLTLTMTTLTCLALFTFVENFKRRSPYVDMLPSSFSEVLSHPVDSASTFVHVVRMTEHHRVMEIAEKRQQRIDDVAKRTAYRKAHGLDETVGFGSNGGWFAEYAKKKNSESHVAPVRSELDDGTLHTVDDASPIRGVVAVGEPGKEEKRKKLWGIF